MEITFGTRINQRFKDLSFSEKDNFIDYFLMEMSLEESKFGSSLFYPKCYDFYPSLKFNPTKARKYLNYVLQGGGFFFLNTSEKFYGGYPPQDDFKNYLKGDNWYSQYKLINERTILIKREFWNDTANLKLLQNFSNYRLMVKRKPKREDEVAFNVREKIEPYRESENWFFDFETLNDFFSHAFRIIFPEFKFQPQNSSGTFHRFGREISEEVMLGVMLNYIATTMDAFRSGFTLCPIFEIEVYFKKFKQPISISEYKRFPSIYPIRNVKPNYLFNCNGFSCGYFDCLGKEETTNLKKETIFYFKAHKELFTSYLNFIEDLLKRM